MSDGPNTYAYVGNNPLNYFDPNGLSRTRGGTTGSTSTVSQSSINNYVQSLISQIRQIDPVFTFSVARPGNGSRPTNYTQQNIRSLQQSLANAQNAGFCGPGASNAPAFPSGAAQIGHIFRNAPGHVNPQTSSSQNRFTNLFRSVAANPSNQNNAGAGVRPHAQQYGGVTGYTRAYNNGTVWVTVSGNGVIQNAGVNRN